jgi:beta-lactamase class A
MWSVCALDRDGRVIEEVDADRAQSTASIGKIFLLCEVAERFVEGRLDPGATILRDPALRVADSGLWQHMAQSELSLADVALLVAAVSDNWATNTLLDLVGLEASAARARALGCEGSGLHDFVRDARGEGDARRLSTGTARELAEVARRIHVASCGTPVLGLSQGAAQLVEGWLAAGVDLSMIPAPLHLDPLAHVNGPIRLWSKTGTDVGVRADTGVIWSDKDAVAYAAVANWDPWEDRGAEAMQRMHEVGMKLTARAW